MIIMVKFRGWLKSHYKNDRPIDGKRPSVPRYRRPQGNLAPALNVHPSNCPKREQMASLQDFKVEWIKFQKVFSNNVYNNSEIVPEAGSEVFVKNLPIFVSDEDMVNFFSKAGAVYKIKIMMEETGLYNRGFCYVTYMDPSMAKTAINELKHVEFQKDTYLVIENSMNNCRIFMGGIPTHKSKDEVWQELYKVGVKHIVDVIMYRSYTNRTENRGFVFVEFQTHEQAAHFRAKNYNTLKLWGHPIIIDWSVPIPAVDESVLEKVKILYLRNLDVTMTPQEVEHLVWRYISKENIQKVYKFKNYAFVHLKTRALAELLMDALKGYFKHSPVEVEWAKPTSKFTSPEYRQYQVRNLTKSRSRTTSTSSNRSLNEENNILESGSSRKFIPSPQCLHERRSLERQRYSSTGSYDFQDSPGSSRSSITPSSSNELSPSYGDVVKGINCPTTHSSPWQLTSPVPCYAEFCSSQSSRSSTPNSPSILRGSLNTNAVTSSSPIFGFNPLNRGLSPISRFDQLNLNPSPNFELQNLNQSSYANPGLDEGQHWNLLDPIREYQRRMSSIFLNNLRSEREDAINNNEMFTCKLCKMMESNH